jgi:ABC-type multidrug transport system fused ATPase/permease subunit
MLVSALAEMATLGAVVPFLALLANPTVVNEHQLLKIVLPLLGAKDSNVLLTSGIFFCIVAISAAMIRILMMWSCMRFSYGLGADIGAEVYRRTLHQSYSWHVSQNSSNIIAAIDKVNHVIGGILTPIMQGSVALVMAFGILTMLFLIDWPTALIAGIGFTLMYLVTTFTLRNKVMRNSRSISTNLIKKIQAVQEGLGGIRDVLLDGSQSIYINRFIEFDSAVRRSQASGEVIAASPRYVIEAVGMVLIVALAYWLSPRQGGLTGAIPVLGALAIGAQKLLPQMQLVYASWSSINGSSKQLVDVLDFLAKPVISKNHPSICMDDYKKNRENRLPQIVDYKNPKPLIALKNVSFRYKSNMPEVFSNINLEIHQGSRVGFIGKTGSGKSTLIDLMMALLQPTSGHVEVDGIPLNEHNYRSWQLRIAHVPQNIYLSDATIAENIAFGIPEDQVDLPRVKIASTKAQLGDFIENLPHKYQTYVGERGVRLSGGQRQRIGLARALYRQADILVLDEATSALDDLTEQSVMLAVKALGSELTVLMIAHRVSTLRDCNKIVELGSDSTLRVGDYENIFGSNINLNH